MSMMSGPTPGQGSASLSDVVTQLQGIVRQLSALVQAVVPTINSGSFTLAAAATTTVTDTNVTGSNTILPIPTNASAATLMGSAKALYISAQSAGSFTVATANAAAAAGTETFDYLIFTPA